MSNSPLVLEEEIVAAVAVLRAINHPLRKKLLFLLLEHKKLAVTDMYVKLRIGQSEVSGHLKIMRDAGLVNVQKAGKNNFYCVNTQRLAVINRHAAGMAGK